MEFIEIRDGLSIRKSSVDSIELQEDGSARVFLNSGVIHESTFPYITLLQLIEVSHKDNEENSDIGGIMNLVHKHDQFHAG